MNQRPPQWVDRFLERFFDQRNLEIIKGDLHELFEERTERHSVLKAKCYYILEAFDLARRSGMKKKQNHSINFIDMWKNYLKVASRNMRKQRGHAFINIFGLSVGLACTLLIALHVIDELSYDRFHENAHRIYRMTELFESEGIGEHSASMPFPVGPTLMNDFPGLVQSSTRLFNFQSPTLALANRAQDKEFNEKRLFFADSTFFDVFDFEFIAGNPETALDQPNSILITATMARKYFGNGDPMGQTLEFLGDHHYQVTGILREPPKNAHFQFDGLISFSSVKAFYRQQYPRNWYWNPCWTYVLLEENARKEDLEELFPAFIDKYFPDFIKADLTLFLQPLTEIHLNSRLDYEIQANGDGKNVYIFSGVAILVLLISIINFVNLSTARSTSRAKEVGVRKTIGGKKGQLISQFLVESILYVTLAAAFAVFITQLVLPFFNDLTEKNISLLSILNVQSLLIGIGVILLVGILGGLYPAFVLSSLKLTTIFRPIRSKKRGPDLRKVLVIFQFSLSIIMIVSTLVALDQLQFMQNDNPGFNKENVIMIPVIRTPIAQHYKSLKNEALQHPGILSMTATEEIVGAKHQVANYRFDQMPESKPFPHFQVRHDFIETFDITLLAGRDYSEQIHTDDTSALIVNEALVETMQWGSAEDAIGKDFQMNRFKGKVVGVIEDYNFVSKHREIGPMVLALNLFPGAFQLFIKYMAVRIDDSQRDEAIAHLETTWNKFMPNRPFEFFYLDDRLEQSYQAEKRLSEVTMVFSFLAILVGCLGLFGLATHSLEQRTKEIGIRKVLGIEQSEVFWLLSKEFLLLIGISFILAAPLAYLGLSQWLDGFAYRINLGVLPFILALLGTCFIAFLTLSYHALRATWINPADVLKME